METLRIGISLICGGALFIYLFIFVFLRGNTKAIRFKEKAKRNGCFTLGKAIKNDYRRFTGPEGRYRSEIVSYEYYVEGKRYIKKITFTDIGIVIKYPNTVEIYYDANNPSKAYADVELSQNKQKQTGCYLAIVIPIIVIIIIYNLLKLI